MTPCCAPSEDSDQPGVWFAFLETESMWRVQERLSEIVMPRYLAEGTDILRQCREVCIWSGWDIWLL